VISKAIELPKGTEVVGFLLSLATEGVEIPQHRHGASGLDCRLPGAMEIRHREQRSVEIIHRAVNGVTGAGLLIEPEKFWSLRANVNQELTSFQYFQPLTIAAHRQS
jgi:hypothetical protein